MVHGIGDPFEAENDAFGDKVWGCLRIIRDSDGNLGVCCRRNVMWEKDIRNQHQAGVWIVTLVSVAGTSCKIRPFEVLGEGRWYGWFGPGGAFHQICLAWYALEDFCKQIRCLSLLALLEVLNVLWSSKRSLTMKRTVLQTAYVCLSHMFTQHFWQAKTKFWDAFFLVSLQGDGNQRPRSLGQHV